MPELVKLLSSFISLWSETSTMRVLVLRALINSSRWGSERKWDRISWEACMSWFSCSNYLALSFLTLPSPLPPSRATLSRLKTSPTPSASSSLRHDVSQKSLAFSFFRCWGNRSKFVLGPITCLTSGLQRLNEREIINSNSSLIPCREKEVPKTSGNRLGTSLVLIILLKCTRKL